MSNVSVNKINRELKAGDVFNYEGDLYLITYDDGLDMYKLLDLSNFEIVADYEYMKIGDILEHWDYPPVAESVDITVTI